MESSFGVAVGFIKEGQCYKFFLGFSIKFSEQQFWEGATVSKQRYFDMDMPITHYVCKLRMTERSISLIIEESVIFWLVRFRLKFMNNNALLYAFRFSHSSKKIASHNVFWSKVDCQSSTFIFRKIHSQSSAELKEVPCCHKNFLM